MGRNPAGLGLQGLRAPDLAALGAFYDRARFGQALRKQAERLARR